MNVYQATIISNNSCFVETVLVIAESKDSARKLLAKKKKRTIEYTQPLKKIKIGSSSKVIEMVGWGNSAGHFRGDD